MKNEQCVIPPPQMTGPNRIQNPSEMERQDLEFYCLALEKENSNLRMAIVEELPEIEDIPEASLSGIAFRLKRLLSPSLAMSENIQGEIAEMESREWDSKAALPGMWEIMQLCDDAHLKIQHAQVVVSWYVFLKHNNTTTLKEFLQKFSEGTEKKDFYEFGKYCFGLYRKVYEKQLAEATDPSLKSLIKERMEDSITMERLGDQCHEDPQNDYWQRRASMGAPDRSELPSGYTRILDTRNDIEDFLMEHKDFDGFRKNKSSMEMKIRMDIKHQIRQHVIRQRQDRSP